MQLPEHLATEAAKFDPAPSAPCKEYAKHLCEVVQFQHQLAEKYVETLEKANDTLMRWGWGHQCIPPPFVDEYPGFYSGWKPAPPDEEDIESTQAYYEAAREFFEDFIPRIAASMSVLTTKVYEAASARVLLMGQAQRFKAAKRMLRTGQVPRYGFSG
jgi:hypothetical protein